MITNILLKKGYLKGYLPKADSAMIQPMFPAANVAIRKAALDEVGLFDTVCKTSGEDLDLCIRMAKTKWELFFEPRAIVRHKHRTTLLGLLKQWYGYGRYHAYIFKKHSPKCIQIHYRSEESPASWGSIRISKIFGLTFPFRILVFVTPFHILNICLLLALSAIIIKSHWLLTVALAAWFAGWLYFSGRPFFQNVIIKRNSRWIIYSMLRYILNWAYVLGAFLAGIRIGIISIEVTREQTPLV
ncbi:MAG: glycosyltransferase family 2 protein [Candidatus Omnitrophica bacterium]|nr:glycosyltransferase family 2 protein [Candidatus Omnitrophota bacterium]